MPRNLTRVYPRPLVPLFFTGAERIDVETALSAIRAEAEEEPDQPIWDGRCIEYLCADWLARWGA